MRHSAALLFFFPVLLAVSTGASAASRAIELILDASGSMNAALPGVPGPPGESTRIAAARAAVKELAGSLPPDTLIALRAYGHQSPRARHDCADTQLLVPFGPLSAQKAAIREQAARVKAHGYTPITRVIELAAHDFPAVPAAAERTLILVSDGKETCDGDPCAAARALKAADAKLVIHAIGFDVDTAARLQLQCVAAATGGTYRDAANAAELGTALSRAAVAPGIPPAPVRSAAGKLTVRHAGAAGHRVLDATTGKEVGRASNLGDTVQLPAGIYNVTFGPEVWKSVVVEAGKTTVLDPAVLEVAGASLAGHQIVDSETGAMVGTVSATRSRATIIPGVYDVTFGGAVWPFIKVDGGKVTVLRPGKLHLVHAGSRASRVLAADGREVGKVSATASTLPLPPGSYTVEIGGRRVPFTVSEGKTVELAAQ